MTVIMATVGFTPAKIQPVIDREDAKEELVLFYDKDSRENQGRSKAAARALEAEARKLGMAVTLREIDAFDLVGCCLEIRKEMRKRAGKDIVVSIAGGARVLSSAALLASILEGARVVHINERTNEVQALPMLKLASDDVLSPQQRRVLQHIRDHPGQQQRELAAALKLTKGTVSHHVQALKQQGLVVGEPDKDDARSERLHAVPSADLLLVA
ncbi:MAG TPA: MarR family transcriptional regulator [Candidatus Thermoplasmatota archaeon]|jgi:CRISPR locus-related DNA-binding protein|nr:MarR family transcriptional regulator [Candidatus Thermoplasmatota archaeon]